MGNSYRDIAWCSSFFANITRMKLKGQAPLIEKTSLGLTD
jgi:hypothetical protein